jgi:hypothetical protein
MDIEQSILTHPTKPLGIRAAKGIDVISIAKSTLHQDLSQLSITEHCECKGPQDINPMARLVAWVCMQAHLFACRRDICHLANHCETSLQKIWIDQNGVP